MNMRIESTTAYVATVSEALAAAILYRRYRKCLAQGSHTDDCQRCGTKEGKLR